MRVKIRESILATIFVLTILIIYLAFQTAPKNYLKISFLDVGQGDAILFQTPTGGNILVDGGRDTKVLNELGEELPDTSKNIDLVIATHDDSDHITGLVSVLQKYNVKVLLYSLPNSVTPISKELMQVAKEKNIKVVQIVKPMIVKTDDGLIIKILFPVSNMDSGPQKAVSNEASVVTQFIFEKTKFLLTGDLPQSGELFLIQKYGDSLQSDILKLGHHGSDTSSNPQFLQNVKPAITIVSAGKNNSYGMPHRSVLDLLQKFNIKVLRTDELGTIDFYSNGLNIWQ